MKKILIWSRNLLWIPIIGSLLLALGCGIIGILMIGSRTYKILSYGEYSPKIAKNVAMTTIETIDLYLIATVAYITAIGLYKLFIAKEDFEAPIKVKIPDLKALKDKIIGVVIAALGVTFLGKVAQEEVSSDLMYVGIGIAVVIIALSFAIHYGKTKSYKS
ncbi:MAG: YqhA family protein [Eudoraea sp.]|uniref:YqhA family protein n=1 Tax=Eudoraea sp. TaxID=1979955 RepID=UPI003264A22A